MANIQKLNVSDLINWDRNPREISEKDFEKLLVFVEKYPDQIVLLVDGRDKRTVLGGNMRLKAIKAKQWEAVDCNIVKVESDNEAFERAMIDNSQFGKYVMEQVMKLQDEFHIDERITISTQSITISDVQSRITKAGNIPDDTVPEVKKNVTVLGDVYTLGGHKVICGDSTQIDVLNKLMGEQKADMVFTDPPYNVDYEGKTADSLKIQNDKFASTDDFFTFLSDSISNMALSIKSGGSAYICHSDTFGLQFRKAFVEAGFLLKQVLIWNKNTMVMGRQDYQWKHEPILYGWRDGGSHTFYGGRDKVTVWNVNKPASSKLHPTMKPVELIEMALMNSSKSDDIVLDSFLGSGSTLIACQKSNRRCFGVELDPKYVDVIINRWCEFTGQYDILRNGETFNWPKS